MEKFLHEAEKFVKSNIAPQIYHKYIVHKRKLIFGPFSEIIIHFQTENKKLLEEINAKLREEPPTNLRNYVQTKIFDMISQTGQTPTPSNCDLNELSNILLTSVEKQENTKRADIRRYRNNITNYDKIIKESKKISIHKHQAIIDNRDILSKKLKAIQRQLSTMTLNLESMKKENAQFIDKIATIDNQIQDNQQKCSQTQQSFHQLKAKNTELQQYKQQIIHQLNSVNEKVQKTILLQRFGPGIFTKTKEAKIAHIMELKNDIQQLKQDQAKLENMKKDKIITSVKTIHSKHTLLDSLARLAV